MKLINYPLSLFLLFLLVVNTATAQLTDSATLAKEAQRQMDSVESTIGYRRGKIEIKDFAVLNLPEGYKFVPGDKTEMIVRDIWGNPVTAGSLLGMVVKEDYTVYSDEWAFVVTFDESGYVKDEDADKINYDELLKDIQKSEEEDNKERVKQGYAGAHLLDWAVRPYYDKDKKILHWAKKLQFDNQQILTLNYDVRVLGKKGVLSLNAVGSMDQLEDINRHIPDMVSSAAFTDGNKYSEFNPSVDKVAAYTIGGLIAGKLIAKTGLFILLLKNIKLIALALLGGIGAFRKRIAGLFSRKKKEGLIDVATSDTNTQAVTQSVENSLHDQASATDIESGDQA